MARMPVKFAEEPEAPRRRLKPYLLLALTVAILAFCATLFWR
ncbi:MAG TPA: hypothetical protein VGL58_17590 [Caulobacteraceae bacterium]|jgi:hypothetical protein